jgi:hypothetical protein
MEKVSLTVCEHEVRDLRTSLCNTTFTLKAQERIFQVNPEFAVEKSNLEFTAYTKNRKKGVYELKQEDIKNLICQVVGFLHGRSLEITVSNARDFFLLAHELGIPIIEQNAKMILRSWKMDIFLEID